jgi:hypothetical protein
LSLGIGNILNIWKIKLDGIDMDSAKAALGQQGLPFGLPPHSSRLSIAFGSGLAFL